METKMRLLWLLVCVDLLVAYPVTENQAIDEDTDPEEYGDYFEGDMELDYEQMSDILYPNRRNVKINEKYRWPGSVVFYEIDPIFEEKHINHIRLALDKIEEATCIMFLPRTETTKGYILVKGEPTGCHSSVGHRGKKQTLNIQISEIDRGCFKLGKIMHEFIHALGFYHQQSASDRDDYVTILKRNIKLGKEANFNKFPPTVVTDFGVKYDYGSIMHYGPKAFSKNGKPTIVPHDKNAEIGQRLGLSQGDITKLNAMYKCPGY